MSSLVDIKLELGNTVLPVVLSNILFKYTGTSIKVEFINRPTIYVDQYEFEKLDCQDVINMDIYGVLVLKNPICKFKNSKILSIIGNVVLIGDVSNMFNNAIDFNSDISSWDIKNVTDTSNMFFLARKFNSDLSKWDTSNITDMHGMFFNARKFNSDLSKWDTSNVTNMGYMFFNAISFDSNSKTSISNWDTSNVTNMTYMNKIFIQGEIQ